MMLASLCWNRFRKSTAGPLGLFILWLKASRTKKTGWPFWKKSLSVLALLSWNPVVLLHRHRPLFWVLERDHRCRCWGIFMMTTVWTDRNQHYSVHRQCSGGRGHQLPEIRNVLYWEIFFHTIVFSPVTAIFLKYKQMHFFGWNKKIIRFVCYINTFIYCWYRNIFHIVVDPISVITPIILSCYHA